MKFSQEGGVHSIIMDCPVSTVLSGVGHRQKENGRLVCSNCVSLMNKDLFGQSQRVRILDVN